MKCYAYLDIETTGLSRDYSELTVIGIAIAIKNRLKILQMVADQISAEELLRVLTGVDEIYTYNGSRFDLPFIKTKLGIDLKRQFRHTDLMYACWKQNLKGGLKSVERQLGIKRRLTEIDGYMAVRLWWKYVNDDDECALDTLLQYNREDVINLHELRNRLKVD